MKLKRKTISEKSAKALFKTVYNNAKPILKGLREHDAKVHSNTKPVLQSDSNTDDHTDWSSFECDNCHKKGGVELLGTESWCCNLCGYWENSFGEKGNLNLKGGRITVDKKESLNIKPKDNLTILNDNLTILNEKAADELLKENGFTRSQFYDEPIVKAEVVAALCKKDAEIEKLENQLKNEQSDYRTLAAEHEGIVNNLEDRIKELDGWKTRVMRCNVHYPERGNRCDKCVEEAKRETAFDILRTLDREGLAKQGVGFGLWQTIMKQYGLKLQDFTSDQYFIDYKKSKTERKGDKE